MTTTATSITLSAPSLSQQLKEARQVRRNIPEWLLESYIPILNNYDGQWELLFNVPVTTREVIWGHQKYTVPPHKVKTIYVLLALPISPDGSYNVSQLHIISGARSLPHVTTSSACLSLGDGPPKITNETSYRELLSSITRAMSVINLDNLYTAKNEWPKDIYRALPMGTRSERRHGGRKFQVAVKKYFTEKDDPTWTTRDSSH
jgi:hypothetical protein